MAVSIQEQFAEIRRVESELVRNAVDSVIYITHVKTGAVKQCDPRPAALAIATQDFRVSSTEEVAAYRKQQEDEAQRLATRQEARLQGKLLLPKRKKGD